MWPHLQINATRPEALPEIVSSLDTARSCRSPRSRAPAREDQRGAAADPRRDTGAAARYRPDQSPTPGAGGPQRPRRALPFLPAIPRAGCRQDMRSALKLTLLLRWIMNPHQRREKGHRREESAGRAFIFPRQPKRAQRGHTKSCFSPVAQLPGAPDHGHRPALETVSTVETERQRN